MQESSKAVCPETRSRMLRAVRKKNTRPEIAVRRLLHAMGFRFRLHRRDLPGCPDIVLPRYRTVVLVHGCFWHQHSGCRLANVPRTRPEYWVPKLARNVARDTLTSSALAALGWRVIVMWECETSSPRTLRAKLDGLLRSTPPQPVAATAVEPRP
ncbi:very short patch repair endonuclease [Rhodoplanes roseus]|uniref:Very short patch repair endonuclease n=1 Tax=Rhodoplanes roseus TaxID=29409 RepID=A0A327L2P9_9BRAD|nr:DNA mismatch endonuclease Vsr [Rhodoplanes roseus]RAI44766.1 very short patch repair endonuclease [Rhodoplanes roseus]